MGTVHDGDFSVQLDPSELPFSLQPAAWEPCFVPTEEDLAWLNAQDTPDGDPPAEPALPFADWIELMASLVRMQCPGSRAGEWLAARIDALADDARWLDADTPDELEAREELLADWVREREREGEAGAWN